MAGERVSAGSHGCAPLSALVGALVGGMSVALADDTALLRADERAHDAFPEALGALAASRLPED